MASKWAHLLPLLWRHPSEFANRVLAIADFKRDQLWPTPTPYVGIPLEEALTQMEAVLEGRVATYLVEPACQRITAQVAEAMWKLPPTAPFARGHSSQLAMAQLCYALCRSLRPAVVVETGVAYGVTSAFTLAALAENGCGHLYSVDLPPLGENADGFVGCFVPGPLLARWQLLRGTSRQRLPGLVQSLAGVDLFVHDSLHTYRNITFELATVMPYLKHPAAIVVDDIGGNGAFYTWQRRHPHLFSAAIPKEEKEAFFGVAILVEK